jgi:imidazolonepropionase-like amidohydrolase
VNALILENACIFDGTSADIAQGKSILIENDRIVSILDRAHKSVAADRIDVAGRVVMPGMIDAHFHAIAADVNIQSVDRMHPSLLAQHARVLLEACLQRGFTTVRDAGGADYGLCMATEQGLIAGPRMFIAGKAISQTGGHGDMRRRDVISACGCGYTGALTTLADGADEVRKQVRETLRQGAHQIKLFVSGGVASPTDPLHMTQMTSAEIQAAVEEAERYGTYVMAHSHTPAASRHALNNGVRSIEHGTITDAATAELLVRKGAFVVPTLVTLRTLEDEGEQLGLPAEAIRSVKQLNVEAGKSLGILQAAGAKIGFGTDLLGQLHQHQCKEFTLRAAVQSNLDILRSATSVNADLLMMTDQIGCIRPGALADILVVDGNPLEDISLFERHQDSLRVIIKGGAIFKNNLNNT